MKRVFTVTLLALLCVGSAKAQMVVELGALTQALMERTRIESVIYYGQMIIQQVQAAHNTYQQVQAALRAEWRALDNLRGITSVNSFSDFMSWYNRQLDLERYRDQRMDNIRIRIGNNYHRLRDIENIRDDIRTSYGRAYWERGLTDTERRAMWLNLGLSPANWAYQNTWADRETNLFERQMLRRGVLEEENRFARARQARLAEEMMADDTTERALQQILGTLLLDIDNTLRDIAMADAEYREHQIAQQRLANAPPEPLGLSGMWNRELFDRPIVPGRFVPFQ